jgi:transcriptional regulator with XRE-family HTH domain
MEAAMAKQKEAPGFSDRLRALRERLGYSTRVDFALALDVKLSRYSPWEAKDAAPSMAALTRAVKRLGVRGWKDLVCWLANGEEPPAWLNDPGADPYDMRRDEPRDPPPAPALGEAPSEKSTPPNGTRITEIIRESKLAPPDVNQLLELVEGSVGGEAVASLLRAARDGAVTADSAGEAIAAMCASPAVLARAVRVLVDAGLAPLAVKVVLTMDAATGYKDVPHNAKIRRESLATWAQTQLAAS